MTLLWGLLACLGPWEDTDAATLQLDLPAEGSVEGYFTLRLTGSTTGGDTGGGGSDQDVDFHADLSLRGVEQPVRVLFYSETAELVPPVTDLSADGSWSTATHRCEILAGTTTECWQDYRVRVESSPGGLPQTLMLDVVAQAQGEEGSWDDLQDAFLTVETP